MGQHDPAWRAILSRDHRAPDPARHAHSARPQAVVARVGFVFLARLPKPSRCTSRLRSPGVSSIDSSAQARRTAGRCTSTAFGGRSCASSKKLNRYGRAWAIALSRAGWSLSRRRLVSHRHSFTSSASRCPPRLRWSSVPLGRGGGSEGYPDPGLMKRALSRRLSAAVGRSDGRWPSFGGPAGAGAWLLGCVAPRNAPLGSFPQKGCESAGFPSGKHDSLIRPNYRVNMTH